MTLPAKATPQEDAELYNKFRHGTSRDEADEMVFAFRTREMAAACPEWSSDRVAQELRDRGYGRRYGYHWTLRVAAAAMEATAHP